jgi:sugar transferase (PEP-CTERM/EpsH1 system associated)
MQVAQPDAGSTTGKAEGARPLVAHIVFRFDYGGLENGIVNIVNSLPASEFGHVIIAMSEVSDFKARIRRPDVRVIALHKKLGKDFGAYVRLWKLLRELKPAIVHTRNIGTMDCLPFAWLAGVPARIHGEHGWDVHDPDGKNPKYRLMRRVLGPFAHSFVTVSRDLAEWLVRVVGVRPGKVTHICNGVDTQRFRPNAAARDALPADFFPAGCVVVGTVTRLMAIKDPLNLVRAFIRVRRELDGTGADVRLALIGDGPLRADVERELEAANCTSFAWLAGSRDDVAALLPAFDVFVLGSLREGISNTVLEAMSSGLPVIASATGGNLELIRDRETGMLVPPGDSTALGAALSSYVTDPSLRRAHGRAARQRAEELYSLTGMMSRYRELYIRHSAQALETV